LKEVIAGLDVIAPHVIIQPTGEWAPRATSAATRGPTLPTRIDPWIRGDRDRDEAARYACDEPELEGA
jgi:hypothetical protein